MADRARALRAWTVLKIKLGSDQPMAYMTAIRAARPDAVLMVDANQGWTFDELIVLAPQMKALGVVLIEQPLQRGKDVGLESYSSPVPLCADESCLDSSELITAARRYQNNQRETGQDGRFDGRNAFGAARKESGTWLDGRQYGRQLPGNGVELYSGACSRTISIWTGRWTWSRDRPQGLVYENGMFGPPTRGFVGVDIDRSPCEARICQ